MSVPASPSSRATNSGTRRSSCSSAAVQPVSPILDAMLSTTLYSTTSSRVVASPVSLSRLAALRLVSVTEMRSCSARFSSGSEMPAAAAQAGPLAEPSAAPRPRPRPPELACKQATQASLLSGPQPLCPRRPPARDA